MEVTTRTQLLVRRSVLAALIMGISVAFLIQGRDPGPRPYLLAVGLAALGLLAAVARWDVAGWIGVLAYVALMTGFLAQGKGLAAALPGLALAVLSLLRRFRELDDEDEEIPPREDDAPPEEADGTLDRFGADRLPQ